MSGEIIEMDEWHEKKQEELLNLLDSNAPLTVQTLPSIAPVIRKRREIAMPYWNRGYGGPEVLIKVNEWLEEHDFPKIGLRTIREDHEAILAEWEEDFDRSSYANRMGHISTLQRIKQEAWASYEMLREKGKQGGGSAANYLKIAMQAEEQIALLDGSKKRAELRAESEAQTEGETTITRVYVGVDLAKLGVGVDQKALKG